MATAFLYALFSSVATAAPIEGVFNTGKSDAEETEAGEASDATLDIRFHACDAAPEETCGTIVRVRDTSPDEPNVLPDGSPLVGFTIITGLVDKGDGKYRKGRINAVDESIRKDRMVWYGLKLDRESANLLKAKGCLGPICPRTMYWRAIEDMADGDALGEDASLEDAAE